MKEDKIFHHPHIGNLLPFLAFQICLLIILVTLRIYSCMVFFIAFRLIETAKLICLSNEADISARLNLRLIFISGTFGRIDLS